MPDPSPKPVPRLVLENVADPGTPARTVRCLYQFSPARYTIHWGDTTKTPARPSQFQRHVYPKPGIYMVSIVLDGDTTPHATAEIDVREPVLPQVSLVPGDDPRYSDELHLSMDREARPPLIRESYYTVKWGDGSADYDILARPGTKPVWHGYNATGDYVILVTDKSTGVTRRFEHTVTDPDFDPDFAVEYDPDDPDEMTAKVTVTKIRPASEGEVTLSWGDGDDYETVPHEVGHVMTHQYRDADWYAIDMWYPDGGEYEMTTKLFAAGGEDG